MNRNPKAIRDLQDLIKDKELEIMTLKNELRLEKELVPVGYKLIGSGDLIEHGAIGYEPYHGTWGEAGNSVGCIINEQGYVSGITHKGWKYANLCAF